MSPSTSDRNFSDYGTAPIKLGNTRRRGTALILVSSLIFMIYFLLYSSMLIADNKSDLLEITKNLRCLVCQGQSIADSNSDFALTIKLVVEDQLKSGKNKNEIYKFLISKYGEWIVYKPSFSKDNFFLWLLPYGIFLFGGMIIFVILKKKKHS